MITKKRKVVLLFGGIVLLILITLIGSTVLRNKNKTSFTLSFDEIKEKIAENSSTCSYKNYFEIVQAEYMIIPEKNLVRHTLIMKNITDKTVTFNYQLYKEQELIDKYLSSLAPAYDPNPIPIEILKGKRAVACMSSELLYPYNSFNKNEIEHIEDLSSKLYIEFYKDGKFDYAEINFKKVDKFTEY